MKKLICILMTLCLLLPLFASCGKSDSPAVGKWEGQYTKFVGDENPADDDEPFYLELKSNGKGTSHRDDSDFNATWKLEGDTLTVTETFLGMEIVYTGSIKDGELHLFNGDPEDDLTVEYVYRKA